MISPADTDTLLHRSNPGFRVRNIRSVKDLKRIAIVGVGLLGGSVGLSLRAAGSACLRIGIGRRRSSLDRARRFDAVDQTTLSFARGLRDVELVVLATPLGRFETMFTAMAPHLPAGCVVTDVGSTKVVPARLAERLLPREVSFVGAHPMAGSEKTGVEFSRADLFAGAPCVVTPTRRTKPAATRLVERFWRDLGCRVARMNPREHDLLIARISHVTHLAAACIFLAGAKSGGLDLAGTGLMDTTRIASGDPGLWRDIFEFNRQPLVSAVDELIALLQQAKRALARGDQAKLVKLLSDAKHRRDAWIAKRLLDQPV